MLHFALLHVYRAISRRFRKLAIAFFGVAVAVGALVLLESIMQGVGDSMVYNTIAIHHGHISCTWRGEKVEPDAVQATSPAIEDVLRRKPFSGTLEKGDIQVSLSLYGVEPEREGSRTVIAGKMVSGDYLNRPGGIILGARTAELIKATAGNRLRLTVPGSPARKVTVTGIYRTGVELLDARTAFVPYDEAPGNAHELAIFLSAGADVTAASHSLKAAISELNPVSWKEDMGELAQLVSLNHVAMNVVLLLALIILAFGVSNTVYISIAERTREFGVLRAMGMTPGLIQLLVVAEVILLISLAGVLGIGLGVAISEMFGTIGLDLSRWTSENPHFLASGVIHPRLTVRSILLPALVALLCAFIAAWMPSRKAGGIKIVDALRAL